MKKTKIIATLGPATNTEDKLIAMYDAGINIIRFNFSHADYE
jgi:pyruvate kinase